MRRHTELNFKFLLSFFIIVVLSFIFFTEKSYLEEAESEIVTSIQIEGNESISDATIISKLQTKIGQPTAREIIGQDLKRLHATGFFADIKIDLEEYKEGVKVIFYVIEKPILEELIIIGNKAIRENRLKEVLMTKEGVFLDLRKLGVDIEKLEDFYKSKGFYLVKIDYDLTVDKKTNRAKLKININEGVEVRIRRITIEGNQAFSDSQLIRLMRTERRKFFISSGFFDRRILKRDIQNIVNFYKAHGYLDAEISYSLRYSEDKKWMFIDIEVEEGGKYFVGKIDFFGNVIFSSDEIKTAIEMMPGSTFSYPNLRSDIIRIQSFYFDRGYIEAWVDETTYIDHETGKVNIIYSITENELMYINKIKIKGNTKTRDAVIRREMRVHPGEVFDGQKIRRSKRRLRRLGFFEDVSFDIGPTEEPNKKNLIVEVKEAKTGEFSFGAGYSSVAQFVGFVEVRQRNFDITNFPTFTGDGQRLLLKAQIGTVKEDYELSFTEPWFFDYPLSFGFDVYQRSIDRRRDIGYAYDQRRRGGALRFGKELGEYIHTGLTYRFDRIKIFDLADDASPDLKREEGENVVSSLTLYLTKDTRDDRFNPTRGLVISNSIETAGGPFGGDKDFIKYIVGGSHFFEHFENLILELRLRAGIVSDYGDSHYVPIYERFFVGGAHTIRGYKERGVGPKDAITGDPIGGEAMLVGTIEYTYPIIRNFRGAIFYDIGNAWKEAGDFGTGDFKSSVGLGARVQTPIGPIRLDWGYAIDEGTGRFHFSMGHRF